MIMSSYTDHAGTMIDIATCSKCDTQKVFDEPRELKCAIGNVEDRWKCILEDLDEPSDAVVICPNCQSDIDGFVYVL